MNTATQLKAHIRNISKIKDVNTQILLRYYMFERLLERVSKSKYKHNFILKGGMLISAIVGIDLRSTMDIDATIKGIHVSKETISSMFNEILGINVDDSVYMSIDSIEDIHDEAEYAGIRIKLNTFFDEIKQTLKVDVTTGDTITPREVRYHFKSILEERSIEVMAYNLETLLAEKLETIISRGGANTRMRDFYDVYILTKLQTDNINQKLFTKALYKTAVNRGTAVLLDSKDLIISEISTSGVMQDLWTKYQKKYDFAEDVLWVDVMKAVKIVLNL